MSVGKFLQNSALAVIAGALAVTAVPASAQDEDGDNGRARAARLEERAARPNNAVEARARMIERQSEQRAEQVDRRSEQRAAQIERQGDRASQQAARQGNWDQARQIDRRSEQTARQVEQRGDWRAGQIERRGDRQADRTERRSEQRADRSWQPRGGAYPEQQRNRADATPRYDGSRTGDRRDGDRNWGDGRRDNNQWGYNDGRRDNNQWSNSGSRDYRRWDRRWRDNNRYDWRRYRDRNRVTFNVGIYYSPYRSYSYRRLGIGYFLDSLFFGNRYWINDPWRYRLPEVYGPYRWVRYYDDVLLVDIYSGEVVDVIYDFFW